MVRRLLLLLTLSALAGCNPAKRTPVDPASLQTDAGEAVLRHVIENCPKRKDVKLAVVTIGEQIMGQAKPEFVDRFRNIEGLTFIAHNRVVAGMVAGKSSRFDEQTQQVVLELQISSLTEPKDGVQEAVAAWAVNDDAARKRLEVKARPGGGFDIRELENIPVPHRNDDTRRAAGKK